MKLLNTVSWFILFILALVVIGIVLDYNEVYNLFNTILVVSLILVGFTIAVPFTLVAVNEREDKDISKEEKAIFFKYTTLFLLSSYTTYVLFLIMMKRDSLL